MALELRTTEDKVSEFLAAGVRKHLEDEVRKRLMAVMEKVVDDAVTEVCAAVMARVERVDIPMSGKTEMYLILDGVKKRVDLSEPETARIP